MHKNCKKKRDTCDEIVASSSIERNTLKYTTKKVKLLTNKNETNFA